MSEREYQYGFSEEHPDVVYDVESRTQKARKMLAVLDEACGDLESKSLLDVGCSTGILTTLYGERFGEVTGIDIDDSALRHATKNNQRENVRFLLGKADQTQFADDSFDVVSCTHIYEHVPDAEALLAEIRRVLKPGGVCYFTAGNRLMFVENHYRLPLLSIVPKPLAHVYLRALGRGDHYYEDHRTLWSLRKLVSDFEVIDFTKRVIDDPVRYSATEMCEPGTARHRLAQLVLRVAYPLSPTYVWVLRKPQQC